MIITSVPHNEDILFPDICFHVDDRLFEYSIMQEMTLEEFEKIREEKRKALLALKTEQRKVEVDKDLQSMQPLSTKKGNDEIFVKLVIFHYDY